jgi:hypothetical protein
MKMRRINFHILPVWPIIIGPLLIFAPVLFSGNVLYWGTSSLQFIPWRIFSFQQFANGVMPLWNPYNGMGTPFIANYQSAVFYPPSWVLYMLGQFWGNSGIAWGFSFLAFVHSVWAGVGMARVIRFYGYGRFSQTIGGIAFSMCGYIIARNNFFNMVWVASWLPWILYFSIKQPSTPKTHKSIFHKISFGLVVSLVMAFLAGHAQLMWYILIFCAFWIIVNGKQVGGWRIGISGLYKFLINILLALIISSIQLLPTLEYLIQSQRASSVGWESAATYSFWPWRFITLVAPTFFGNPGRGDFWGYGNYWEDAVYFGLSAFILCLFTLVGIFNNSKNNTQPKLIHVIRYLWLFIIFGFLISMGKNTGFFPFFYRYIPTFNMFNGPSRMLIWCEFGLCFLAGVGTGLWKTPVGRGLYWTRLGTAGALSISIGALTASYLFPGTELTFIKSLASTGILALLFGVLTLINSTLERNGKRIIWEGLAIAILITDLSIASWGLLPVTPSKLYESGKTSVPIYVEKNPEERIYLSSSDEYLLKYSRYLRFTDFRPVESISNVRFLILPNINLIDGYYLISNFDPFVPARYKDLIDYLDGPSEKNRDLWLSWMAVGLVEQVDINSPMGVSFRSLSNSGRFRFYSCSKFVSSQQDAWAAVLLKVNESRSQPEKFVVLESKSASITNGNCITREPVRISNLTETPNVIEIDVDVEGDGWVVVADTWFPGWIASVNDHSVPVIRADYIFRAIPVVKGLNHVVIKYRPMSFIVGGLFSIFGSGWMIFFMYNRRKNSNGINDDVGNKKE